MNWKEDKYIILLMTFFLSMVVLSIVFVVWHDINYVCTKGHYETQVRYNVALKIPTTQKVWICDEEMLREDYDKLGH